MSILDRMTIRSRLVIFLVVTLLLFCGYAFFSYNGLVILESLTHTIYEHPLQVSNASLEAKIGILKIHRALRKAPFAKDSFELHEITEAIRLAEKDVYKNLDIIRSQILGNQGQELEFKTRELYHQWTVIRNKIIALASEGKSEDALAMSRMQGDAPVAQLELRLRELTNYARNKADGFIKDARREERRLNRYSILYAVVLIAVTVLAAMAIIGNISANLRILRTTMSEIVDTGVMKHAAMRGSNELTELADVFNTLLDKLHWQLWLREGFNGLNTEVSGRKNLQEVAEKALSYLAHYIGACTGVCYLWDKEREECRLVATFAYVERNYLSNSFKRGEGVVGQVALEKQPILLERILQGDAIGRTGTVSEPPRNLYAFPLFCDGELEGVMELASFESIDQLKKEFLNQTGRMIGYVLHTTRQSDAIRILLAQSRETNTALEIRSEELDKLNSELAKANAELESQSRELQSQATELRAQKSELEVKRAQIEEADRLKSEFLSNMSHELRTPLNSILALSQLMINRGTGQNRDKEKQYLEIIERNGQHLLSLINDILDLTKIESGRMEVYPEDFHVAGMVKDCLQTIRPVAKQKGLQIESVLQRDFQICSDRGKVSQILLNLLSNAVKFTDQGQVSMTVRQNRNQVDFIVQDSGVGIDPGEIDLIFDEFRQVDGSTTRRHDGTGLGLAICRKLAKLLEGDISVESVKGRGSTFTLQLPLLFSGKMTGGLNGNTNGTGHACAQPRSIALDKTILVIDDDTEVCAFIQKNLEKSGFHVVTTTSSEEGLALAKELKPYAVTLDLLMPGRDGWEMLNELKSDPSTARIPVIIISVSDERDTGIALGASGYLLKPVNPEHLLSLLRTAVPGKSKKNVLVVDDDPGVVASLEDLLQSEGVVVQTAANGVQAMESITRNPPDIVLLDLVMPEMDGFALIGKIREAPETRHLPLIVLTGKDLTQEESVQLNKTVRNVMQKGLGDKQEILKQVDAALLQIAAENRREKDLGPHIVIIEDNSVAALQMKVLLADHGYAPHVILESVNAINILKQLKPEGIILDLMMPEVNGFETLEAIRRIYPDEELPVLVLTAKDLTSEDRERLQSLNVRYLVQKGSMVREQLIRTIDKVFKPHQVGESVQTAPEAAPVLLVEDNADNVETLSAILQDAEISFLVARNGDEAIAMAAQEPSLILMDIQLPGISGLEATQAIKADAALAHIPVIAMTAKAMRGDKESILAAGCDDYLAKPINPESFVEMINRWRLTTKGHPE